MGLADIVAGIGSFEDKVENKAAQAATSVLPGILHAGQGVMESLGAPSRGLAGAGKYVEDRNLGGGKIFTQPHELAEMAKQGGRWFMNPNMQGATSRYDRHVFSTDNTGGGFIPTDQQINAHLSGLPATLARGAAQAGSEVLADPTSYIPAGAIGKVAKAIPGVTRGAEALSKSGVGQAASALFNPEHHLGGLTEHGQNVVEGTRNRFAQLAEKAKRVEDLAISQNRKAIKAGKIPADVAAAFKRYGVEVPEGVTKPSALMEALDAAREAKAHAATTDALRSVGLLSGDMKGVTPGLKIKPKPGFDADALFKGDVSAAQAGVAKHLRPTPVADNAAAHFVAKTNRQLKSMFLAVPLPHVMNLTNLSYNKYGLGPTIRGLAYAAQEATGLRGAKLNELVDQLQKIGADNQYSKLFSEVNPIAPIRQVQRLANKAQDTVLNPVERGLRASMLQTELARGKQGVDAARNIHKALGSDANTGLTNFLNQVPLSQFPRFHTQTAIGSFGRTLVDKPGRITGFEHVFGGPDQRKDGKAHYHLSTPSAAGLNMLNSPLSFVTSPATLGGLAGVTNPYSTVGALLQAYQADRKNEHRLAHKDYQKAAASFVKPGVPAPAAAIYEMLKHRKGEAGETGLQDLFSALAGGYWSKQ